MTTKPPPPTNGPISREQATAIAREAILKLKDGFEFQLREDETIEKDWGWVFFYTTKKYLETGDEQFIVPGTGPVVVERSSGAVEFLTTSVPPQMAVKIYETRRAGGRS